MQTPFRPAITSGMGKEAISPQNLKTNEMRPWFRFYIPGPLNLYVTGDFGGGELCLISSPNKVPALDNTQYSVTETGVYLWPSIISNYLYYRWVILYGDENTNVNVFCALGKHKLVGSNV